MFLPKFDKITIWQLLWKYFWQVTKHFIFAHRHIAQVFDWTCNVWSFSFNPNHRVPGAFHKIRPREWACGIWSHIVIQLSNIIPWSPRGLTWKLNFFITPRGRRPRGVWKIKANFLSYGSENSKFRQKDTKVAKMYQKVPRFVTNFNC